MEFSFRSNDKTSTYWYTQINGFLRAANNLIAVIPNGDFFNAYENVFAATSIGVEWNGNISLLQRKLSVNANTTYQSFRNTSRDGDFQAFRGDRIPNRPFFFLNGALNYRLDAPFRKADNINIFANTRYVAPFFRTWESAGNREFKAEIPKQNTYGLGLTYALSGKTRWSLTAEVQNLTDAKVFDFLGVQRPGRAFYLKLTTQL